MPRSADRISLSDCCADTRREAHLPCEWQGDVAVLSNDEWRQSCCRNRCSARGLSSAYTATEKSAVRLKIAMLTASRTVRKMRRVIMTFAACGETNLFEKAGLESKTLAVRNWNGSRIRG